MPDSPTEAWRADGLKWMRPPTWASLSHPVEISLDTTPQYGFAAISSPLPGPGDWLVRLRLGPTFGEMRLVTCDPDGQRREPRTDLFPTGPRGEVIARIAVPPDYLDMCLVIQKRSDGPGSIVIEGVDLKPAEGDDAALAKPVEF